MTDDPGFHVSIRDVWLELQEVKTVLSERLPPRLEDRLNDVEDRTTRLEEQVKTLFGQRAPRLHPASLITTIAATVIASLTLIITLIDKIGAS